MSDSTVKLSVREYDSLKSKAENQGELIGQLRERINTLESEKIKNEGKEPQIKVTHMVEKYVDNGWGDDENYFDTKKVEYVNMDNVVDLVRKGFVHDLKNEVTESKSLIRNLRSNVETLQEKIDTKERQLSKAKVRYAEEVEDLKDRQSKEKKELEKAYDDDVKTYGETIDKLEEEILKIKENKTDVEIEEKRNKEIKTLKGRINDLERILNDLKGTPFFKRIFKLRTIQLEENKAANEFIERRYYANNVGITYVKENGKVSRPTSFKNKIHGWIDLSVNEVYAYLNNLSIPRSRW